MEVSGQLHAPAALPAGKEPLVPIGQESGMLSISALILLSLSHVKEWHHGYYFLVSTIVAMLH
jgi:hypothetical protein